MIAVSLPFTRAQFFSVFAAYNEATWPAAIGVYLLAMIALAASWRGGPPAVRWAGAMLALMWGWVGAVYQGVYFSQINPVAKVFAGVFLLQALLFAGHAALGRGLEFGPRSPVRTGAGAVLIIYAMVAYPLIGLLVGERYPAMPLFGVAPCPLLIFTLGLFVWASRVRWWLWIVPGLWTVIGGSAAVALGVPQDWGLPASAIGVVVILTVERRRRSSSAHPAGF